MCEPSRRAGEIIGGFRNYILLALSLKSRSGPILVAPEGGVVERRSGKMMD
jgi:hypothetical protein